jgi:hypothetical protein
MTSYEFVLLSAISVIYLIIASVNSFNLESRLPIVKYGDPSTYFGYSVAEHVQGELSDPENTKW